MKLRHLSRVDRGLEHARAAELDLWIPSDPKRALIKPNPMNGVVRGLAHEVERLAATVTRSRAARQPRCYRESAA